MNEEMCREERISHAMLDATHALPHFLSYDPKTKHNFESFSFSKRWMLGSFLIISIKMCSSAHAHFPFKLFNLALNFF
jgi:hypothetical protein